MTITKESPDINSAKVRRRRHRAMAAIVGGAGAIALLAFFGTVWSGADDSTVASGQVRVVDQTIQLPQLPPDVAAVLPSWLPPVLQQVDDSGVDNDDSEQEEQLLQRQQDQDEANLSENNAIQSMIQSQQQAEQQNDQAEQQFTQDELQAQQTEQEADQS